MEFTGLVGQAEGLVQAGRGQDAGQLLRSKQAVAGLVEFLGGLPADQWARAAQLMADFHGVRVQAHDTPSERRACSVWGDVAGEGGDAVDAVDDTATAVFEDGTVHGMAAGVALGALVMGAGHGSAQWPMWAGIQADRLQSRFDVSAAGGDLEAAIVLGRAALDATEEGSPGWAALAGNQAHRLHTRFMVLGAAGDLEAAIVLGRAALDATGEGSPDWALWTGNQANRLESRFGVSGAAGDLEAAIDLGAAALDATGEGSPDWALWAGNQANRLESRFGVSGAAGDLEAAIDLGAAALDATEAGSPTWASWARNQANRLQTRFEVSRIAGDLEAAIELGRAALDATQEGSPGWAARAGGQAGRLEARFEVSGDARDLEAAIELGQAALDATEEGSPDWALRAGGQAGRLQARFQLSGVRDDLQAAIELGQAALDATGEGSPDWALWTGNQANRLQTRFQLSGVRDDLQAAIELGQAALDATVEGAPNRATWAGNQAGRLHTRFGVLGVRGDLEAALELGQAALHATEEGSPTWAGRVGGQANRLQTRFEVSGAARDLEAAIDLGQAALDATQAGSPTWALWAGNQAGRLQARFEVSGAAGDLEAAIDLGQAALDATVEGAPGWAVLAGNQATRLQTRFEVSRAAGDLEAAIELGQAALHGTGEGSPTWAGLAGNQANRLSTRFQVSGAAGDLEAAIELGRAALHATGEGSPIWAYLAGNQANRLWGRSGVSGDVGVAREAVGLVGRVAALPSSLRARRVLAGWVSRVGSDPVWWPWGVSVLSGLLSGVEQAVAGGEGGAGLWGPWWAAYACEVAEALQAGGVIDAVSGVDEGWLRAQAGRVAPELVGRADLGLAEVVARAGLVAAESSRGRWLSRAMLSRRTDFGRLREADVGLADELDALTREIAGLELAGMGPAGGVGADPGGGSTARLAVLRARRVGLVEQIRGLPGLADFGRAPGVGQLVGAVPVGSVAVVPVLAPGRPVGFLLVVADDTVRVVRLPAWVTHESLTSAAGVWAQAHVLARRSGVAGVAGVNTVMARVLAWVWAGLVVPLQAHLDAHELTPQRVWWVPNGPWTDLPAGLPPTTTASGDTTSDEDTDDGDTGDGDGDGGVRAGGVGVLRLRSRPMPAPGEEDEEPVAVEQAVAGLLHDLGEVTGDMVSGEPAGNLKAVGRAGPGVGVVPWSRMPTLALLGDLTPTATGGSSGLVPAVVVAGVGTYPRGLEPLPSAPVEASLVAKRRGAGPGQRLLDDQATAGAVLGLLAQCPDLHAAVHAALDRDDPGGTALEFYDAPVTLAQISDLRLSGRLAVLSACQTHTAGGSGEEHLTLTAAVQLAGYTHAIGSLTEVEDWATSELMVRLHQHLATGADPAHALHHTLTWARTHWPDHPHKWATWTHTGP